MKRRAIPKGVVEEKSLMVPVEMQKDPYTPLVLERTAKLLSMTRETLWDLTETKTSLSRRPPEPTVDCQSGSTATEYYPIHSESR
jgi:hypothetical protein